MGLFREQALAAYANPDARGGLLRAAPPSGIALFAVLGGTLACATAVAASTPVVSSIEARGVVGLEHGAIVVRATRDGTVTSVHVSAGADLAQPRELLALDGAPVVAPASGHVEFVDVRAGDVVTRGTPLVELVPDDEPLVGYLLVPASERARLSEGQTVQLRVGAEIAGTGTIADISAQPVPDARRTALFGPSARATTEPIGRELLVRVTLPHTTALSNGAPFVGEISLGSRSALSILVPALARETPTDRTER